MDRSIINRFSMGTALLAGALFSSWSQAEVVHCDTAAEIQDALKGASPGDEIVIAPGVYVGDTSNSGYSGAHFYATGNGTSSNPIIVRSEFESNPATLKGSALSSKVVLHVRDADHWEFRNLKVSHAQKGVMLDNANHNLLHGLEVYDTRDEGVHFRDGSSSNVLQASYIHDTGSGERVGYGEGVYVGTAESQWDKYDKNTHDNVIRGNRIGPDVGGEHVDVKEGSLRTIVEFNVFDGTGISGDHYADSFIDTKGNEAIIRYNTGYRNGNGKIEHAFANYEQKDGWGVDNVYFQNIVDLDGTNAPVVKVSSGSVLVAENYRENGNTSELYSGNHAPYSIPFLQLKPKSDTSFCVTPHNGDLSQNNPMVINTCGSGTAFKWKLINMKNGYVKIANAADLQKNIKVYLGAFSDNAEAVIYEDNSYHSQIWKVVPVEDFVAFESRSDSDYFLKVRDGVFEEDQAVVVYRWHDWGSQMFVLE